MAAEETPQDLLIEVNGVQYPFPSFETLTYKEARLIKKITGVVMGKFFDALEDGDPDALVAVALVALGRAGTQYSPDELDDLPITNIKIIVPETVEEEVAPASPLEDSEPSNAPETSDETVSNVVGLSGN